MTPAVQPDGPYHEVFPIEILVIQPTAFCNVDCSYCYIPGRDKRQSIDEPTLRGIASNILVPGFLGKSLLIAWHCGEPLTLPISFYENAFCILNQGAATVRLEHNFQTNSTLITPDWAEFFVRHQVSVGISLDGPEEIHNKSRRTRSGNGTHGAALQGLEILRARGVAPSVICVLTENSLQRPKEIFWYFERLNLPNVSFNVEEQVGANKRGPTANSVDGLFQSFLETYLDLMEKYHSAQRIREIDQMAARLFSDASVPRFEWCSTAFRHLCVDVKGNYWTFAPELGFGPDGTDFVIGNCRNNHLSDVVKSNRFTKLQDRIERGVSTCRSQCSYFELCGGGNPANKYAEAGAFEIAETRFCRTNIKVVTNLLTERLLRRAISPASGTALLE